jgi:hypothetical protein
MEELTADQVKQIIEKNQQEKIIKDIEETKKQNERDSQTCIQIINDFNKLCLIATKNTKLDIEINNKNENVENCVMNNLIKREFYVKPITKYNGCVYDSEIKKV